MSYDLKNKEELKLYLENLGIEYRFGCFSEKNPEACHLLGDYLDAIKNDYEKAAKLYKTNCDDNNFPRSCHSFGNYALIGKGKEKQSFETAYKYYLKACELNVGMSCFNAGVIKVKDKSITNIEQSYIKAIELLDKGCNLHSSNACYYLSGLYISGSPENNIEKDMKVAFKYSEKACDLGHVFACANLSLMYKKGEGVEKNDSLSDKYKNKANQLKAELEVEEI